MCLKSSPQNPFMYMLSLTSRGDPIYIGIYVYEFFYFIEYDAVEEQFRTSLSLMLQVEWQDGAHWFLGTSLEWSTNNQGDISVHMCQSAFVKHTSEIFGLGNSNRDPLATPYHSRLVPSQDGLFFYTRSHLSALQNCALLLSTNF